MKTYNNLYKKLCSIENLELAFKKARKGKSSSSCVVKFEENLSNELINLKHELESLTYYPKSLRRFIVRDPKTRKIKKTPAPTLCFAKRNSGVPVPLVCLLGAEGAAASKIGVSTL